MTHKEGHHRFWGLMHGCTDMDNKVQQFCIHPEKDGWYYGWSYNEDDIFFEPRVFYVYHDADLWFAKTIIENNTLTIFLDSGSILFCWYPIEFNEDWRARK